MRSQSERIAYVLCGTAAIAAALALFTALPAAAQVTSDEPAAVLIYPYIAYGGAEGTDTIVQLSNSGDGPHPISVRCFYQRARSDCHYTAFTIRLTPFQPIAWRASAGLPALPLSDQEPPTPSNSGLIPPVPDDPYVGTLQCIAVDDDDVPLPRNDLTGAATVEQRRTTPTPLFDASTYRAIGFRAHDTGDFGDAALVLGGASTEYDACPLALTPMHFFDGAIDPVAKTSSISTSLVLVSCSQNLTDPVKRDIPIEYEVVNEFEQRLQTTSVLHGCAPIGPLSQIDTDIPERSIFHTSVTGTLTGQTRISAKDDEVGVLGLMIETHHDLADPALVRTAIFTPQNQGVRMQRDAIILPGLAAPRCTGDCNNDLSVTVDELLTGVGMALGTSSVDACPQRSGGNRSPFDFNYDGQVTIDDILRAVNNALYGCL